MIMTWAIQIEKTTLSQRNLIDLLHGVGYYLVDVPKYKNAFSSKALECCANANDVWTEVKKIREIFVDAAEIDPEMVLGPVLDLSSDIPQAIHFAEVDSMIMESAMCTAKATTSPPSNLSVGQYIEWYNRRAELEYKAQLEEQRSKLEPAFFEPRAIKVLQLLNKKEHTGESLYKIYEIVEENPSHREDFHKRFGVDPNDFKRFADAVHNPLVSGELARHAYTKQPQTSNPMTISEAQGFVTDLAKQWLASLRHH
jgi:hypothetical protein